MPELTTRLFHIGERVRIHPASDWYMRGVTHAVITSARTRPGQRTIYYLRCDTAGVHAPKALRLQLTSEYFSHLEA